jgi:hypothetical protein
MENKQAGKEKKGQKNSATIFKIFYYNMFIHEGIHNDNFD